jgi:CheY-like chemotaxis protein
MYRILIVEDIENTLHGLKRAILASFSRAEEPLMVQVHTAESVAQGNKLIEAAYEQKKPYHAVILDFYLPAEDGLDATKMDESLCLLMRDLMPSTLVAHITAYPDHGPVKQHLLKVHQAQIDPRAFALSKLEADYADDLINKLKAFFFGVRIEEQMDALFGHDLELSFAARGRLMRNRGEIVGSLTHNIAALSRDIEMYWKDLDDMLKARIKRIFRVETVNKEIRVSLLQKAKL